MGLLIFVWGAVSVLVFWRKNPAFPQSQVRKVSLLKNICLSSRRKSQSFAFFFLNKKKGEGVTLFSFFPCPLLGLKGGPSFRKTSLDLFSRTICWLRVIICIRVINIVPFGRQVEKKQTALLSGALLFFLFFCFLRTSFLVFYFFFELLSFPIIGLILIWGRQPERLQASLYLMAYVFLGGVPFLFALLYNKALGLERSSLIYLVFLIKTPIYLLHFWLPKVHVESPTVGSVLLAALLLKVGAYAMARLLNPSRCLNVVF